MVINGWVSRSFMNAFLWLEVMLFFRSFYGCFLEVLFAHASDLILIFCFRVNEGSLGSCGVLRERESFMRAYVIILERRRV